MITRKTVADAVFTAIDNMSSDLNGTAIDGTRLSASTYLITGGGETYTVTVARATDPKRVRRLRMLGTATRLIRR